MSLAEKTAFLQINLRSWEHGNQPHIDDRLVEEARKVGGHRTKKEAVTQALKEYVQRHKRRRILAAFGTVDFDPTYDYKAERWRKRLG